MLGGWRTSERWRRSGLDQSAAGRIADETGGFMDAEFFHDARSIRFGGFDTELESAGDLFGGVSLGDELQHFALARRQRIGSQVSPRQIRADNDAVDATGTEIDAAADHFANGVNQFIRRLRLDDVAADAGAERGDDLVLLGM